jgi:hypothetical protein
VGMSDVGTKPKWAMSAFAIVNEGISDIASTHASLTGLPSNHIDFDLPIPGIVHTACPHHYRPGHKKLDRRHRGNLRTAHNRVAGTRRAVPPIGPCSGPDARLGKE